MATLDELERRIAVAGDLQGLVRTMKAISAVGIRQHQAAVAAIRAYVDTIELGLRALGGLDEGETLAPDSPSVAIVIGSDIGLCGGFNAAVAGLALPLGPGVRLLAVGDRAAAELDRAGRPPAATLTLPHTIEVIGRSLRPLLAELEAWRARVGPGRVLAVHNRLSDDGAWHPVAATLLPLAEADRRRIAARRWRSRRLPLAIGTRPALGAYLGWQLAFARLHAAMIESRTAEHAARLSAMQAADRSIADKREALQAAYRSARQDAVTDELMDLVASFEALDAPGSGIDTAAG